ncbi:MAG TPA: ABC transporter permease [Paludibacter sp.]|nr:ABC transporter permease [Paludibacter sp.]
MITVFKTTFRNFVRKPATNLINLFGLAVSLALVIILSAYSYSELTTDNYHKNGDRVYWYTQKAEKVYPFWPAVLKDQIDLNIPGVENTVRLAGSWEKPVFRAGDSDPITSDLVYADNGFFKLFTYQPVEGNLETSLKEPMTIVLTEELSEKLFGKEKALGKTVKMNNDKELTVSAVIKNPAGNTTLSFNAITSVATRKIVQSNSEEFTNWGYCNFQTFVLLKKGVDPGATAKKIANLFPKDDRSAERYSASNLIPLKEIYFSDFTLFGNDYLRSGSKGKIMILLMVAMLVLMIALVNFINISSSQWVEKIRQTGVMKVLGAHRSAIFKQILLEALLLFMISFLLAIFVIVLISPYIRNYTGIQFNQYILYSPLFLLIAVGGIFLLCLAFSFIPALRISSSNAIDNLKKSVEPGANKPVFRGILVTIQFVIAIVLIAFTLLVQKQVDYGKSSFEANQENIIGIKLTPELLAKKDVIRKLFLEMPSVKTCSFTEYYPGSRLSHWASSQTIKGETKQFNFDIFNADSKFFEIMGLKLVQGHFYSDKMASDANAIVVNEEFVRAHGIENPVGTKFMMGNSITTPTMSEIVGVVKDFHYKPVSSGIAPLVIWNNPQASYCMVNIQATDFEGLHNAIQKIKTETAGLSPSFPVEVSFFDQAVGALYQSELQFRHAFSLFAGCAIVICCLGILAMSLLACQRRIKEVGIRKVNGACVSEIMTMLNRDFVKWVAIAFVIATPIAWYAMKKWLENFVYKTELSWWIFALAGVLALAIAILTVSWQSWRAATRNPVEALQYE